MIKKYFTSTLRHLWRYRLFTTLNIFGLAIGISACWIIFRIVSYEFSYEKNVPGKERIYRVISGFIFDDKESYNGGVSAPLYLSVREQISGLENTVAVHGKWMNAVKVNSNSTAPLIVDDPANIVATDSNYFNMVPYHWIAGNKSSALTKPESVVLTESRAKKYFPGMRMDEIINNTLTYYGRDTTQRTITGIVADITSPTEFTGQEFIVLSTKPYELSSWTNTNGTDKLYLQLKQGTNPAIVLKQVESIANKKWKEFEEKRENSFKSKRWFELLPLNASHFSTYIQEYNFRKASKPVLYGLIGIGIFLLLLACINYVNMSVARIPQQAKEIGVRKTLGSSQSQLIAQFLSETLLTTLIAGMLSSFLSIFGFWLLKDIIPEGITPFGNAWQLAGVMFLLIILITLLAGIYPAWLITRVKTINVFRSFLVSKKTGYRFSLQKVLITFQFVIALIFITCALIIGRQLQYTVKSDMGFDKDAVLLVNIPWKYVFDNKYENKKITLFNELKKEKGIQGISLGNSPLSDGYSSSEYEYAQDGKEPIARQVFKKWVDTAYINLYQLKLLAGRNLHVSDTTNEFVINESAVRAFGFASPQDALGKFIGQSDGKYPIVGVVKDFHLQDFYKVIQPAALSSDKGNQNTFNIKLQSHDPSQWQATIKAIEKAWYQFYPPETFSYTFYDEELERLYVQERNLSTLINLATIIAIFISCLGLFGLVTLTAFQRTKEIGIRKVLGASVSGIVRLLSKEYIQLVILALLVAAPVAWWAMNKWLQKFTYRIEIQWWMFVVAGLCAIVIAMFTISFQAIKAAVANPVKSLRTE